MPRCYLCGAKRGRLAAFFLWSRCREGCGAWYCTRCWATGLSAEYETDEYAQVIRRHCRKCGVWIEEIHILRREDF